MKISANVRSGVALTEGYEGIGRYEYLSAVGLEYINFSGCRFLILLLQAERRILAMNGLLLNSLLL